MKSGVKFICPEAFLKLNEEETHGQPLLQSRNAAAGSLRQLDPEWRQSAGWR